jgi:hypothetical protein
MGKKNIDTSDVVVTYFRALMIEAIWASNLNLDEGKPIVDNFNHLIGEDYKYIRRLIEMGR